MAAPALNPDHPMAQLGSEHAIKFIGLMLWKLRRHCPNLACEITVADMQDFDRAFMQGNQTPVVAFIGKKEAITLQLVDAHSGQVLLIQDGDPNSPRAVMQRRFTQARGSAQAVIDRLVGLAKAKKHGPERHALEEAAESLRALTWEPKE